MDIEPCICETPGYCHRYRREMSAAPHSTCKAGKAHMISDQFLYAYYPEEAARRAKDPKVLEVRAGLIDAQQQVERPTEEEANEYPGVLTLGVTFLAEWRAWKKAGKPVVSEEVREQRRSLCLACPKYDPKQDRCTACGCYLHKIKVAGIIDADALSWATKQCPLPEPRWLKTV